MKLRIVFLCLAILLFSRQVSAEDPTANVLIYIYPPYGTSDGSGLAQQLVKEAFRNQDYNVNFTTYPYKRSVVNFQKNNNFLFIDIIQDYDRRFDVRYAGIFSIRSVLVYDRTRFPDLKFKTIETLKGKTIGVMSGTRSIPEFKAAGLVVDDISNDEGNIKKLVKRRIDLWASLDLTAMYYIDKHFPHRKQDFEMIEYHRLTVWVKAKGNSPAQKSLAVFEKGISNMKQNGTYLSILEKFYGKGEVPATAMAE